MTKETSTTCSQIFAGSCQGLHAQAAQPRGRGAHPKSHCSALAWAHGQIRAIPGLLSLQRVLLHMKQICPGFFLLSLYLIMIFTPLEGHGLCREDCNLIYPAPFHNSPNSAIRATLYFSCSQRPQPRSPLASDH